MGADAPGGGSRLPFFFRKASANMGKRLMAIGRAKKPPKIIHRPLLEDISRQIELTKSRLKQMSESGKTVLIGPWVGEIGFELLYWIPFLKWAKSAFGLDGDRLVAISRGGAASWYAEVTPRYLDILDWMTPDEFRTRNEERWNLEGKKKQKEVSEFESEILDRAKSALGAEDADLLHPSLMYNIFRLFWKDSARWRPTTILLDSLLSFRKLPAPPALGSGLDLPADYVAAKFYFNDSFPDTETNRAFVLGLLRDLAEVTDVMVLSTGFTLDDHVSPEVSSQARIHLAESYMTPRNNLAVQSLVISRARGFVGTYGGFAYLAPFYGVDSLSFYSDPKEFRHPHLHLAEELFSSSDQFGGFQFMDTRYAGLARAAFGGKKADAQS